MKVGTIVRNGYASKNNPIRYGLYLGGNRVLSFLPNGHTHFSVYDGMLKDERFEAVGFIDIKGELEKHKSMEEE